MAQMFAAAKRGDTATAASCRHSATPPTPPQSLPLSLPLSILLPLSGEPPCIGDVWAGSAATAEGKSLFIGRGGGAERVARSSAKAGCSHLKPINYSSRISRLFPKTLGIFFLFFFCWRVWTLLGRRPLFTAVGWDIFCAFFPSPFSSV